MSTTFCMSLYDYELPEFRLEKGFGGLTIVAAAMFAAEPYLLDGYLLKFQFIYFAFGIRIFCRRVLKRK